MHDQPSPLWKNTFMFIVVATMFFNVIVMNQGEITFPDILGIIVMLFIMIMTLRNILRFLKARFMGYEYFEEKAGTEAHDEFGQRTAASYEKEQLRKLEDLYRSNLISKEEYEEKRKEIIKNL